MSGRFKLPWASAQDGGADAQTSAGSAPVDDKLCLQVDQLDAWYGQAQALRHVSLTLRPGEIVGLLGRNGAGKSTMLRSLARLQRRVAGHVYLYGTPVLPMSTEDASVKGISLVREGAVVYESLTISDHLELAKLLARRRGAEVDIEEVAEWFPVIWERRTVQGGYLSGGQRQMLSLAMGFLSQPTCLLLDEPSAGLAESVAESVYESIRQISIQKKVSLLIAEQDDRWIAGLAGRAYVIDNGMNTEELDASRLGTTSVG